MIFFFSMDVLRCQYSVLILCFFFYSYNFPSEFCHPTFQQNNLLLCILLWNPTKTHWNLFTVSYGLADSGTITTCVYARDLSLTLSFFIKGITQMYVNRFIFNHPSIRTECFWFLAAHLKPGQGMKESFWTWRGGRLLKGQIFSQCTDTRFPLTEMPKATTEQYSPLNLGRRGPTLFRLTLLKRKKELWL